MSEVTGIDLPGVRTVPPPASIAQRATEMVTQTFAALPAGTTGAFIPIVTRQQGKLAGNAAFVQRVGDHVRVVAWVGKTWGEPVSAGGAGVIAW